ncbi:MAG: nuclear transport factor 2 family protein [Burkholderiaceae bacterium]|nr:nuclear transport factor 2 family protein [Burkholderiaceae bacterium]
MQPFRDRSALSSAFNRAAACLTALLLLLALPVSAQPPPTSAQQQVFAAERAFARSMADRDAHAFARFIAEEAIFFSASTALRGKAQVVSGWARFFEGQAPFSWEPDQVEVLESGNLALSTGLVRDPDGKVIARFNSVWRLEAPGVWRVVFDKGSPPTAAERQ